MRLAQFLFILLIYSSLLFNGILIRYFKRLLLYVLTLGKRLLKLY